MVALAALADIVAEACLRDATVVTVAAAHGVLRRELLRDGRSSNLPAEMVGDVPLLYKHIYNMKTVRS
jgi:hypothetical protein